MLTSDDDMHRDHASCIQLDLKCIAADVSTDFDRFSLIFMDFRVIVNENNRKSIEIDLNRSKYSKIDRNTPKYSIFESTTG